jgi:hypothetical protein
MPTRRRDHAGGQVTLKAGPSRSKASLYPTATAQPDRYAQASILNLYDPDRATRFASSDGNAIRDQRSGAGFLGELAAKASANQGET